MRTHQSLCLYALLTLTFILSSCSTAKRVTAPTEDLLIGKWVVKSVNVGGEIVPASLLGREIAFEFNPDGTAKFTTPSGEMENGQYTVKQGKIYDPSSPKEDPVDIITLSEEELVLGMVEEGERLEMTLVAQR